MSLLRIRELVSNLTLTLSTDEFDRTKQEALFLLGGAIDSASAVAPHARLSPRETEVMTLMLGGSRLRDIATRLEISVKTVTTHRARLLRKLGVADNLGLYRYGIRNGLIGV
jgi:DNA-binding NarL/FixJ family response regulator